MSVMIRLGKNSRIENFFCSQKKIILFNDSVFEGVKTEPTVMFSYVDSMMKPWMEQYIRYTSQPRFRIIQGIRDFFLGVQYGFPICCVIQFCLGTFLGAGGQGEKRGFKYTEKTGAYVPCFRCKNLSSKQNTKDVKENVS